uniref:Uncharacterized protein n=1 Tax=Anguilla anguilla TaxID=7936 RepID=A0A0E9U7S4_ANGAN
MFFLFVISARTT